MSLVSNGNDCKRCGASESQDSSSYPRSSRFYLSHADKDVFPNVRVLIDLFPATSAEAERSFSVLRRLKTPVQNSMREDR